MAGSKLSGNVVTTAEVHLVGRLPGEGCMRNHAVVLLRIEGDELLQGREGVELVQVEPAVFQGAPPSLDHGVREADLDLGEHPAKRTGAEQRVDFLVHVLDTRVGNDGGCVATGRQMLGGLTEELAGGARFQVEGELPGQDAPAEVVYGRVQVGTGSVEQLDDGDVDLPIVVGSRSTDSLSGGSFSRSYELPETADLGGIKADLKNGVLTVRVGKKPEAQPRSIPVTS
jgi:hypothetical protein